MQTHCNAMSVFHNNNLRNLGVCDHKFGTNFDMAQTQSWMSTVDGLNDWITLQICDSIS